MNLPRFFNLFFLYFYMYLYLIYYLLFFFVPQPNVELDMGSIDETIAVICKDVEVIKLRNNFLNYSSYYNLNILLIAYSLNVLFIIRLILGKLVVEGWK